MSTDVGTADTPSSGRAGEVASCQPPASANAPTDQAGLCPRPPFWPAPPQRLGSVERHRGRRLGLRLAASRYRVDVVRSTTWEEATAKVGPWIRQRTRWIKGYILTAAVNLRRPVRWVRHNGWRGLVTMGGLILGTPLAFLFYPLMLGFTLVAWLLGPVVPIVLPDWLLVFGMVNMVGLNLLMVLVSGWAAWRRYNWRIGVFAVFVPIYWLLHSWAAWRAAIQVGRDPHRWEKTPHGLTEEYDDGIVDTGGLPHSASS